SRDDSTHGLHDYRRAAHDAVALLGHGEHATPSGGAFDRPNIAKQGRIIIEETTGIGTEHGIAGFRRAVWRSHGPRRGRRLADNDTRFFDRVGENLVVARQAVEFGAGRAVEVA